MITSEASCVNLAKVKASEQLRNYTFFAKYANIV